MTLLQIQLCQEGLKSLMTDRRNMPANWDDFQKKWQIIIDLHQEVESMKPTSNEAA